MTGFFDEPSTTGTNRAAPPSDCPTCGGDKLVVTDARADGTEEYGRCPDCAPGRVYETREPVQVDAWWKT